MLSDHVPKVHCLLRLTVAEPLEEKKGCSEWVFIHL